MSYNALTLLRIRDREAWKRRVYDRLSTLSVASAVQSFGMSRTTLRRWAIELGIGDGRKRRER